MKLTTRVDSTQTDPQTAVDQFIMSWKARQRQLEQDGQMLIHTPAYQAALEELEKRRTARGSRTVNAGLLISTGTTTRG